MTFFDAVRKRQINVFIGINDSAAGSENMEVEMVKDKVLDVLKKVLEDEGFLESQDFIEDGWLDSMEIMDLVAELEEAFDIEFSGGDIIPENFVSIEAIARLVVKYVGEE